MGRNTSKQITNIQEPPVNDPKRAPYTPDEARPRQSAREDANAQAQGKDHVYGVESRDRWPSSDSKALAEQHRDSMKVDSGEESEEEEEEDASNLTVAQLKAALDEAGIEYDAGAKKADLVALYNGD